MKAILDKVIYVALLVILVITPIPYGSVETWSTALWEVLVFATMLLWGFQVIQKGRLNIALNPLVWPILALLLIAVIQLLPLQSGERRTITFDQFATTHAAVKLFALICFFLLFSNFVVSDERRNFTVKLIIVLCTVIALIGIGQSYIGKALWQRGAFGPFVNRNHFAGFLEMGAGLAGGLIVSRSVKKEVLAIYISCALAMCAGIVLSASRGGVMALGAEVFFLAIVALPSLISRKSESRPGRFGLVVRSVGALVLGTAAIFGSMFLVGSEGLVKNIAQTQDEVQGELPASERFSRRDIWNATSRMIGDHPVFGVGLGAFQFAYTRYDQSSGTQRVEQSHNDYLQIVADAGFAGGAVALVFVFMLFALGFRAAQTRDRRRRAIIFGALTGCFAIAIHSFVEFNLQITSNAQLFLALVALATPDRNVEDV